MPKRTVPKGKGARMPVMMRVTRETKTRLVKAASKSGRSLAQEAEYRVQKSFDEESLQERFKALTIDAFIAGKTLKDFLPSSLIKRIAKQNYGPMPTERENELAKTQLSDAEDRSSIPK